MGINQSVAFLLPFGKMTLSRKFECMHMHSSPSPEPNSPQWKCSLARSVNADMRPFLPHYLPRPVPSRLVSSRRYSRQVNLPLPAHHMIKSRPLRAIEIIRNTPHRVDLLNVAPQADDLDADGGALFDDLVGAVGPLRRGGVAVVFDVAGY